MESSAKERAKQESRSSSKDAKSEIKQETRARAKDAKPGPDYALRARAIAEMERRTREKHPNIDKVGGFVCVGRWVGGWVVGWVVMNL